MKIRRLKDDEVVAIDDLYLIDGEEAGSTAEEWVGPVYRIVDEAGETVTDGAAAGLRARADRASKESQHLRAELDIAHKTVGRMSLLLLERGDLTLITEPEG